MADVQLFDLRNRGHRRDVRQGEPMPGVHRKTELGAELRRAHQRRERRAVGAAVTVTSSVQLHCVSAEVVRGANCFEIRIHEKTYPDAGLMQAPDCAPDPRPAAENVETAFGGDLLTPLGNERDLRRTEAQSDGDHFLHARGFEIEKSAGPRCERLYVGVLHVTAVFAEMRGDAVGASRLTDRRRLDRTRLIPTARLPQCRDMVDVDAEALVTCSHLSRPLGSLFIVEKRVKKLLLALLVLSACSRATTTTTTDAGGVRTTTNNSQLVGGSTPKMAVEQFLAAVRAQDLQAMSVVFGTSHGASRDNMDREQLDKRLIILQCYFYHDKFRILGDNPGEGDHRVFNVELTRGRLTRTPRFYAIEGPNGRWFVDNMEIAAVREFCRESGTLNQKH